jgi:hypothetical protein
VSDFRRRYDFDVVIVELHRDLQVFRTFKKIQNAAVTQRPQQIRARRFKGLVSAFVGNSRVRQFALFVAISFDGQFDLPIEIELLFVLHLLRGNQQVFEWTRVDFPRPLHAILSRHLVEFLFGLLARGFVFGIRTRRRCGVCCDQRRSTR